MSGVDVSALLEQKLEEDRLEEEALIAKEKELKEREIAQKRKASDVSENSSNEEEEQTIRTARGVEVKRKKSKKKKKKKKKKKYEEDRHSRSRSRRRDYDDYYDDERRDRDRYGRDRYGRDRRNSRHSKRRRRSPSRDRYSSRSRHRSRSREPRRKRDSESDAEMGKFKKVIDTPEELALRNRIRDQCTVMVAQLPPKSTSQEVADFFTSCGRVRDVKLIKARRRDKIHKGIGYVEFDTPEQAAIALNMVGVPFQGRVLVIQPTQNEKNRAGNIKKEALKAQREQNKDAFRVYVGSLHFEVTEDILTSLFSSVGPVVAVNLIRDDVGNSRGFGFVTYGEVRHKERAIREINGTELMGRHIKVNAVGADSSEAVKAAMGQIDEPVDADDETITMTKQSRANLMARLGGLEPIPPDVVAQQAAAKLSQNVSVTRCIVFENMFNAENEDAMEGNDNWEVEIHEDVRGECERFGVVEHSTLQRAKGSIYVKFSNLSDASKAYEALNGRHFGGNTVVGLYISPTVYDKKFGLSK